MADRVSRRHLLASLAAAAAGPSLIGKLTGRDDRAHGAGALPPGAEPDGGPPACPLSAALPPGGDPFSVGVPRGDGTFILPFERGPNGLKIFRLRAAPINWEVEPGVVKRGLAFNGIIPGPTIRVNEGDRIRIVVTNAMSEPTVIHWHGMVLPWEMDGVHGVTQRDIEPGQAFVYEYDAVSVGTHWYHPHMTGDQVGKGLYGSIEVVPRGGEMPVNRDYRLFIGDTNLGLVFNGKSFPATQPLVAAVGERVRIRMTNVGEMTHPIHLHGQPFQVVAQDGFALPQPWTVDTQAISTAQTFDIKTSILAPGRWVFHCHIFSHMHQAEGGHMTGLVTFVDVPDETGMVPNVFGPPIVPGTPVGPPAASVRPPGDEGEEQPPHGGSEPPPIEWPPSPPGEGASPTRRRRPATRPGPGAPAGSRRCRPL